MKLREIMTRQVVRINPEEPVSVAARMLEHYNVGALPVCDGRGQVCGLVTDRDLVTRCIASGRNPVATPVRDVMTRNVISAREHMDAAVAAHLMGREQIRRLVVIENGKLCGMVSLGDLANREQTSLDAGDALTDISSNLSVRD